MISVWFQTTHQLCPVDSMRLFCVTVEKWFRVRHVAKHPVNPAYTSCHNDGLMIGHCLWLGPNIRQALCQCLLSTLLGRSRHMTLIRCCYNVGPSSTTLDQHYSNTGSTLMYQSTWNQSSTNVMCEIQLIPSGHLFDMASQIDLYTIMQGFLDDFVGFFREKT